MGETFLVRGRWAEAEEALNRSAELHRAVGSAAGEALVQQRLAELTVYRGGRGAADHLRRGFELAHRSLLAAHLFGRLYATDALAALERGEADRAAATVEEALEADRRFGSCASCSALLYPVAAEAYARLGLVEAARHYAQVAADLAERWQSQSWRAMADHALGSAAWAAGDLPEAQRRLLAAAATFERIGQRFDAARCLREAGLLAGSRDHLNQADAVFATLG